MTLQFSTNAMLAAQKDYQVQLVILEQNDTFGFEDADNNEDLNWLTLKIANLRIFGDENEVMNLSLKEVGGDMIIVSQFTLHANTKKGNRPSYIKAAKAEVAIPLYEAFITQMETELCKKVQTGKFGADMKVALLNDGPVTIIIDTKNKE